MANYGREVVDRVPVDEANRLRDEKQQKLKGLGKPAKPKQAFLRARGTGLG